MEEIILNPVLQQMLNNNEMVSDDIKILGINTEDFDGSILPKNIVQQEKEYSPNNGVEIAVFGFAKANNTNNTCGPASMATMMNYYGFGWGDIKKEPDGYYENESYIRRIMQWSGAPDALFGIWGTTPMRIVESMKKLKLNATWYANGDDVNTVNYIKNQINQNKPIFVLVDYGQINPNSRFVLDWQIAYKYDENGIYCKVSDIRNNDKFWNYSEFQKVMQNSLPGWNRTLIAVQK